MKLRKMPDKEDYIVISLGGSIMVPGQIDTHYLIKFIDLIKEYVAKGFRFAIVAGGGKFARYYQDALKEINNPSPEALDWIGIHTTRINAELLKTALSDFAHDQIIIDPMSMPKLESKVVIGAGWKPGRSSDYAAVLIAEKLGAKKLANLSNIDYAYDKDPRKNPDAKPIMESSWHDFRNLLPKEWDPGLSAPFDPIAAQKAEEIGLEIAIMNGRNLDNLREYFDGKKFKGTTIK